MMLQDPREFRDRMAAYADLFLDRLLQSRPGYETVGWEDALRELEPFLGGVESILREQALAEVEENARRLLKSIRAEDPFLQKWAADSVLARCCYLVCRLLKPEVVLETGVAYGISSAFILRALEENGLGTLHSVDLPPLRREYERFWGIAVDKTLKKRWRVHRGASKQVLPELLGDLGAIDLFLHDSLHTRRNMRREFETVWPRLRRGGVILADDVERNRVFGELREKTTAYWRVVRDRERHPLWGRAAPVTFGIAIK